jgi:hypothetical protein
MIDALALQAPVIPSGPAWAVALVLGAGGVVLIIREIGKLLATRKNGGGQPTAVESRLAGGDAATLLSEVRENRRQVMETHEIVTTLAKLGERSAALLEQVTAVVVKTDNTLVGMGEATQAMSRMLQLHTGLLDKSALQIDAIFTRTEGSQAAIKAILKKKRRRGR